MSNFNRLVKINDVKELFGLMLKTDHDIAAYFCKMQDAKIEQWYYGFFQYDPESLAPALLNYVKDQGGAFSTAFGLGLLSLLFYMPILASLGAAVTFTALNHATKEQLRRIREVFIRCFFPPNALPGKGQRYISE